AEQLEQLVGVRLELLARVPGQASRLRRREPLGHRDLEAQRFPASLGELPLEGRDPVGRPLGVRLLLALVFLELRLDLTQPSLGFAPGPALPLESLLPCLAERFVVVADVAAGVAAIGGRVVVALAVAGRPTRDDRQPDAVRPQPPASDPNRITRHRGTSPVCSLPGRRRTGPGPTPPLAPRRADGT